MTERDDDDPMDFMPEQSRQGLNRADVLAVLAVSALLAAIGLTTFFVTTAFAG